MAGTPTVGERLRVLCNLQEINARVTAQNHMVLLRGDLDLEDVPNFFELFAQLQVQLCRVVSHSYHLNIAIIASNKQCLRVKCAQTPNRVLRLQELHHVQVVLAIVYNHLACPTPHK